VRLAGAALIIAGVAAGSLRLRLRRRGAADLPAAPGIAPARTR
jgi:O-acetylserine/cysteine efflux transporter